MEEKHAIEVTDLVISYQNLKKTSIKKNLLHFRRQKITVKSGTRRRNFLCRVL